MEAMDELEAKLAEIERNNPKVVPVKEEASPTEAEMSPREMAETSLANLGFSAMELAAAKAKYGKVQIFPWSDEELYVFRACTRKEWRAIQAIVAEESKTMPEKAEEMIMWYLVKYCCIFPRFQDEKEMDARRAGLLQTLSGVIHAYSGFISTDAALRLVVEV